MPAESIHSADIDRQIVARLPLNVERTCSWCREACYCARRPPNRTEYRRFGCRRHSACAGGRRLPLTIVGDVIVFGLPFGGGASVVPQGFERVVLQVSKGARERGRAELRCPQRAIAG